MDLLSVPSEVWYRHLAPYLRPSDFINFFRFTCKALLVEPDLKGCREINDLDNNWELAIKYDKPNIILDILRYRPSRNPSIGLGDGTMGGGNWQLTLSWASNFGYTQIARCLLADRRVNPAARDNDAIKRASRYGHLEIVILLLADERVNPAAEDNYAIRFAAEEGHNLVVSRLLEDHRVNPAAKDDHAIRWASQNGHDKVVGLLLLDDHCSSSCTLVNPAAHDHYALKQASRNRHSKVVQLLMQWYFAASTSSYPARIHEIAQLEKTQGNTILYDLIQADS